MRFGIPVSLDGMLLSTIHVVVVANPSFQVIRQSAFQHLSRLAPHLSGLSSISWFKSSRSEADDSGVSAVLLEGTILLQRHDAPLVRDGPREVELLLADGAHLSRVGALFQSAVKTHSIDAAMKYYDKTQFGRDRTPGDPQRFHNVNSLVWRCGAAGVRALPVLTAHDISLPEQ